MLLGAPAKVINVIDLPADEGRKVDPEGVTAAASEHHIVTLTADDGMVATLHPTGSDPPPRI